MGVGVCGCVQGTERGSHGGYPCIPLVCVGLWGVCGKGGGGEVSPLGKRGEGVWLSEGVVVIQLC